MVQLRFLVTMTPDGRLKVTSEVDQSECRG
jgi:hypothetical protein